MKKISDIISTPVISLYEGECIGIIYNILFDYRQKSCNYAYIVDDEDNIPRVIRFKDIYKIGSQCIFIKNKSVLSLSTNCDQEISQSINPINLKVYNTDCEFLGTSIDVEIDDKNRCEKIILNNGKEINRNQIFNLGKNTIIISNNKSLTHQNFKPKSDIQISEVKNQKVVILSDKPKKDNKEIDLENNAPTQTKILTDYRFLIGRTLNQDILALNGEIIAKKNATITKDIVNKASFYGKLVEIARYSIR